MKGNVHYIYQVPLFKFRIDEIGLSFNHSFVLTSLFYPAEFMKNELMKDVKLVKVSSFFYSLQDEHRLIENYKKSPMLFGESLFFGGISRKEPNQWKLIGKITEDRRLEDISDLRSPDFISRLPPENRKWQIMKNSRMFCEEAYIDSDYLKSAHLEVATAYNYGVLLMRIYFEIIKNVYIKSNVEWTPQRFSLEIARCIQRHWAIPDDDLETLQMSVLSYCADWFHSGLVKW